MEGTPYPEFQFEKIRFINCLVGVFFFQKRKSFLFAVTVQCDFILWLISFM